MSDPTPPSRVIKRGGRVVDFDADRISRSLFAAGESLGRPDAFAARELADGVVHFLAAEHEGEVPTTQQIAEVVVKVVRELGQPALAAAYEEHGRSRPRRGPGDALGAATDSQVSLRYSQGASVAAVLADCARRYTLQSVYTRDLAAAQEAGLLTLTGLEAPDKLAGCVLGAFAPLTGDVLSALEQARARVGRTVAFDGLDHLAATTGRTPRGLALDVAQGLRLTGLEGVVNLAASPPPWAGVLAQGPLFAAAQGDRPRTDELADALLEELLQQAPGPRIDWHLSESSFEDVSRARLLRVAGRALAGANIGFVFDRHRKPVALAEGLDRSHPASLLTVGLNLPVLARLAGMLADAERFCQRLGPLVRLALSAALQKRRFLRRHCPAVTSGFVLDRARFVVAPVGLDAVVRLFTDWGLSNGGPSLELGRQVVQRLRDVVHHDGRAAQMDACLDGPFSFGLDGAPAAAEAVAGLTPWDAGAAVRSQLRAGGALHGLSEHGTLALFLPADESGGPEQLVEWLRIAWRQGEVVRLRVVSERQG
jgi:hypothetical protein